ncbi:MAG TPA: ferrochelatase [Candidatus Eremiobacteraceae bacterium]|nr:ferrochelatase [Candidatus Eremiobacteraceae bacterium]
MASLNGERARAGVVVLQLGGPDTLADVRPFLYNFFCDLLADNVKPWLVKPLAALIAALRAPHSRKLYASIGGGSPIRAQTQAQADALRDELRRRGRDWPVYVAMRNWKPDTESMMRRARADGITDLAVLPLYPQYSFATTRSSVNELRRVLALDGYAPRVAVVDEHCDDPRYIAALVAVTRRALDAFRADPVDVHLIFSAHGLPVSYIEKGDPYLDHVKRTVAAASSSLAHPGPVHLAFQSRLGPQVWLKPSTDALLEELGASGARAACIVPVAFVTEHVETLNEIDIEYHDVASHAGLAEFDRACAVKCHPEYVRCLADLAERALLRTGSGTPARA